MKKLRIAARQLGLMLGPVELDLFQVYQEILLARGQSLGLVGKFSSDELEVQHLVDSLTLVLVIHDMDNMSVVDVGTGAGLPGLPLKIINPSLRMTFVDAKRRSCSFLRTTINQLGLENVAIVRSRAETYARSREGREMHDLAVSRAVAGVEETLEYTLPLIKPGGQVVLYRGDVSELDRNNVTWAAGELGGRLAEIRPVKLGNIFKNRFLLRFTKTGATPDRYPRRVGIPGKRPLAPGPTR